MSIVGLLIAWAAVCQNVQSQAASAKCGSYCIYAALRGLDLISEPYSNFEKGLPPVPSEGYSFSDLEQIAQRFGAAHSRRGRSRNAWAAEGRRACIALLNQHFVVVKDIRQSTGVVSIIDPPGNMTDRFGISGRRIPSGRWSLRRRRSPFRPMARRRIAMWVVVARPGQSAA